MAAPIKISSETERKMLPLRPTRAQGKLPGRVKEQGSEGAEMHGRVEKEACLPPRHARFFAPLLQRIRPALIIG